MANAKVNRRTQRTRAHLHQALLSLVVERGYQRVTVQDILDRANVGRTTFYAHFRDKDELLMSGMEPLRDLLMKSVRSLVNSRTTPPLAFVEEFFRHGQIYIEAYRALSGAIQREAQTQITAMLIDVIREELKLRSGFRRSDSVVEPVAYCIAGAIMGLVAWWAEHERAVSTTDLWAAFQRIVLPGFEDVIRRPVKIAS